MLLPARLRQMKLGVRSELQLPLRVAPLAPLLPASYGRMVSLPRIEGHNDQYGDCADTAAMNAIVTQLGRVGDKFNVTDNDALELYEKQGGYVLGDPSTDRGTDPVALFDYWRDNAVVGTILHGVARVDHTSEAEVRGSIVQTGGVYLVVNLSIDQQNQRVWTPGPNPPGTWGEHAIWADEFSGEYTSITTWGEEQWIDRSYFQTPGYVTAAYCLDIRPA